MKTWIKWTATALVASTVVAYTQRERITLGLIERVVSQRMADPLQGLPDGLHVALCGTGSPFPDPKRAAPCTLIIAGQTVMLFDAGGSASKQIARMELNTGQIDHVFLTHFHSDHIDGLGELMMTRWAQQTSQTPLTLHGPPGTQKVLEGFRQAYAFDTQYRTAHHGAETMPVQLAGAVPREFDVTPQQLTPVLQAPDLEVQAFAVDHSPIEPAVGYTIRYKNRMVVLSGDTKRVEILSKVAHEADLLIHEALNPDLVLKLELIAAQHNRTKLQKIFHDITDYHTTPEQAAELAQQAGVKALVFSHVVPPLPLPTMKAMFLGKAPQVFKGTLKIGEDGDFISLPAGHDRIEWGRRWGG